jgi:hypothetical protein
MNIADLLYEEVDDSCAMCGLRETESLTIHHIDDDRAHNEYDNKIVICHNCHHRLHNGKGISEKQVGDRKRHLIQKTLTRYGVNALKMAARSGFVVAHPFLLYYVVEFGYMKHVESIMTHSPATTLFGESLGYVSDEFDEDKLDDQVDAIVSFTVTDEGRKLVSKWF